MVQDALVVVTWSAWEAPRWDLGTEAPPRSSQSRDAGEQGSCLPSSESHVFSRCLPNVRVVGRTFL